MNEHPQDTAKALANFAMYIGAAGHPTPPLRRYSAVKQGLRAEAVTPELASLGKEAEINAQDR